MAEEKSKWGKLFDVILSIILFLLAILVIFWLVQLIFGGSPSLDEFNFALIIMTIGFIIKIYREIEEIKVGIRGSFNKIKNDIDLIKHKLKI